MALRKLMLLTVMTGVVGTAQAGVCDAQFMHDGGAVQLTGTGNLALGADLSFAEVSKSNGDNCRARVQGVARFSCRPAAGQIEAGLFDDGQERPGDLPEIRVRRRGAPAFRGSVRPAQPVRHDGKLNAGQKLPGSSFRLKMDAPVGGQPSTTVRIGQKTVGQQKPVDTALGKQSCHPITYTRNSDPTMASFQGLTIPIPGMNTTVTDWYCPAVNLVMKQDRPGRREIRRRDHTDRSGRPQRGARRGWYDVLSSTQQELNTWPPRKPTTRRKNA